MASSSPSRSHSLAPPAAPAQLTVVSQKQALTQRRGKLGWEKGDLLAIPLCILWGAGLWASAYGPWSLNSGVGFSLLWSVPSAVVRYLFGW